MVADCQKAHGTWRFGDDGRIITFSNTYDAEMSLYLAYDYGNAIVYYGAIVCDYENNTYDYFMYVDAWDDLTLMSKAEVKEGRLDLPDLSSGILGFPYEGNIYKNVWIGENLELTYIEDSNGNKILIDDSGNVSEFMTTSYIEGVGSVVYAVIMNDNWDYVTYTIVDMNDHLEVYYDGKMEKKIQIDYESVVGEWSNGISSFVIEGLENENGDILANSVTLDGVDYALETVVEGVLCYELTNVDDVIIISIHNDNYEIRLDTMQESFTPQMSYEMFDNLGYRMTIIGDSEEDANLVIKAINGVTYIVVTIESEGIVT